MPLNLQAFVPRFGLVDTAGKHENLQADELYAGVQAGENVIFYRSLYQLHSFGRLGKSNASSAVGFCFEPVSQGGIPHAFLGGVSQNQCQQPSDHPEVPKAIPAL
jgi:hypothetical protein